MTQIEFDVNLKSLCIGPESLQIGAVEVADCIDSHIESDFMVGYLTANSDACDQIANVIIGGNVASFGLVVEAKSGTETPAIVGSGCVGGGRSLSWGNRPSAGEPYCFSCGLRDALINAFMRIGLRRNIVGDITIKSRFIGSLFQPPSDDVLRGHLLLLKQINRTTLLHLHTVLFGLMALSRKPGSCIQGPTWRETAVDSTCKHGGSTLEFLNSSCKGPDLQVERRKEMYDQTHTSYSGWLM